MSGFGGGTAIGRMTFCRYPLAMADAVPARQPNHPIPDAPPEFRSEPCDSAGEATGGCRCHPLFDVVAKPNIARAKSVEVVPGEYCWKDRHDSSARVLQTFLGAFSRLHGA